MSENVYDNPPKSDAEVANEFQEARDRIDEERRQRYLDDRDKEHSFLGANAELAQAADDVYGVSPAEQLSRDWNIPRDIAAELTGLEARKGMPELGGRTATEEEVEGWNKETDRLMRQEFGTESDSILEEMRTLVATRPELAKALGSRGSGSGSHPTIVLAIARAVKKRMDARK